MGKLSPSASVADSASQAVFSQTFSVSTCRENVRFKPHIRIPTAEVNQNLSAWGLRACAQYVPNYPSLLHFLQLFSQKIIWAIIGRKLLQTEVKALKIV